MILGISLEVLKVLTTLLMSDDWNFPRKVIYCKRLRMANVPLKSHAFCTLDMHRIMHEVLVIAAWTCCRYEGQVLCDKLDPSNVS